MKYIHIKMAKGFCVLFFFADALFINAESFIHGEVKDKNKTGLGDISSYLSAQEY
jgi:hypothetical protein